MSLNNGKVIVNQGYVVSTLERLVTSFKFALQYLAIVNRKKLMLVVLAFFLICSNINTRVYYTVNVNGSIRNTVVSKASIGNKVF